MWWLSFCDPDKPSGQSFLGVAVVPCDSDDVADAAAEARHLGCNPGGEVLGEELLAEVFPHATAIEPDYIGRLLTREEAEIASKMLAGSWYS